MSPLIITHRSGNWYYNKFTASAFRRCIRNNYWSLCWTRSQRPDEERQWTIFMLQHVATAAGQQDIHSWLLVLTHCNSQHQKHS